MMDFNDILHRLESDERKIVIPAVEKLVKPAIIPLPKSVKEGLIGVVEDCETYESNAPLWAIVILGERQMKEAIPALLDVFHTDADFWCEAAEDALTHIAAKYPDETFDHLRTWLKGIMQELEECESEEERDERDREYSGRVYAYTVLEALSPREDALRFLMAMAERDEYMLDFITSKIPQWPLDPAASSFLRRQAERAIAFAQGEKEGNRTYIECAWALIHAVRGETGERFPYRDRGRKDWRERWDRVLSYSEEDKDKTPDVKVTFGGMKAKEEEAIAKEHAEFLEKMEEDKKYFREFEPPPFNIDDYLAVRPRSPLEQKVHHMLEYYGLSERWSVEAVQARMSRARVPSEVQQPIFDAVNFKDLEEARTFSKLFGDLWNATPREEFNGLTPNEKVLSSPFRSISHDATRVKVGRNDPCPCGAKKEDGSARKYKHCCGK